MMIASILLVAAATASGYDASLCETAQRMIVNATQDDFEIEVLTGESNGFHVIQMDAEPGTVTIATTTGMSELSGQSMPAWVGCKMVNRERVNDVLGLQLSGERNSCREVNEHTYALAIQELSSAERQRFEAAGRKLFFSDDYVAQSGAEWLPSKVGDYISSDSNGLTVTAPSVQVPWDSEARSFYQGTHHCKLITLATMQRWLRLAAFTDTTDLFPETTESCTEPTSMTSAVGSCRFWFAPAKSMFCQDYSGSGWTEVAARSECAKRHASPEALVAADSRYEGDGGVYDPLSCTDRPDSPEPVGTCVFHCKASDETLWHTLKPDAGGPAGAVMMSRACDLYIEP
jgi:hypothetical protein